MVTDLKTIPSTPTSSGVSVGKKVRKLLAKERMRSLLEQKRYGNHAGINLIKSLIGFLVCLYAGKLAVTGFYDFVWETHTPLRPLGIGLVTAGVFIPAVTGIRARRHPKEVSIGTAVFVGFVLIILGAGALTAVANLHGVTTNTSLWHYMVRSTDVRHQMMRSWPEGLIGGLLWVQFSWNSYKRRSTIHWYERPFNRAFKGRFANLVDDTPIAAWMIWITPLFVVVAALPIATCMYLLTHLINAHATGLHHWLHQNVPWHVKVNLSPSGQAESDKVLNSFTADWPIFLIGFASANFFGRVPAFGVFDETQLYQAQRRISKKGSLKGAISWWQMSGYQARIIEEWQKGEAQGDAVDYARANVIARGPGVVIPLKIAMWAIFPLVILGGYYLYYVKQ